MVENLRADYVRTAIAKGLTRRRAVGIHTLRNSLIPVVTYIGVDVGALHGRRDRHRADLQHPRCRRLPLSEASIRSDGVAVVGTVTVLVLIFLVANLIVDLLYGVLDPRIRYD